MKERASLEKYISVVMRMKQEQDTLGTGDDQWFFRGQSNAIFNMRIIENDAVQCQDIFNTDSNQRTAVR